MREEKGTEALQEPEPSPRGRPRRLFTKTNQIGMIRAAFERGEPHPKGATVPAQSPKFMIHARLKEFAVPPITDGLVLGKSAPIGVEALRRALNLLIPDQFEHVEVQDEVVSDLLIKTTIIRRLSKPRLLAFLQDQVKPYMTDQDIFHLQVDVDILLTQEVE